MGYISELRKQIGKRTIIMPCACVIIHDKDNNVLLQKRVDDGFWSFHGGAIEIDEEVEEAAKREVKEELNLDLEDLQLFKIYSGKGRHHIYPNGDEVSSIPIIYTCDKFRGDIKLDSSEVSEVRWFSKNDLPKEIEDKNRLVLNDFFKQK